MTPAEIIQRAAADGVQLIPTPSGTLKASGDQSAINRWLPVIKARKPEIIAVLRRDRNGLEQRIREMGKRWNYSFDELADVLILAHRNPMAWQRAVELDESREDEFRQRGFLPRCDA